jgi:hypothetical protein
MKEKSMNRLVRWCFPLAIFVTACNVSSDDTVGGDANVILGRGTSALSAAGISALNGSYGAGCDGRSGSWSVGVNGGSDLANTALTVQKNDGGCILTLTSIQTGSGVTKKTYLAGSGIALGTSWASVTSFKDVAEDPVDFYGNAMISSLSYSDTFTITVKVSADHNDVESAEKSGAFETESATVTAQNLAAPNYTISMEGFSFQTDNNDVVQSTSGSAALSLANGQQSGQDYAVHHGQLSASSTPADVAAAYAAASVKDQAVGDGTIDDSHFGLDTDDDLTAGPAYRTIIIRNTESETGLVSYQLIQVAFYEVGGGS